MFTSFLVNQGPTLPGFTDRKMIVSYAKRLQPFSVRHVAVFGSVARDEAQEGSDIDILVEFEPGARVGLFEFVRLQRLLSEILGCPVDLATPKALREDMRERILQDAVDLLHLRLCEQRREQIAQNAVEARAWFAAGQLPRGTVDDLLADLPDEDDS